MVLSRTSFYETEPRPVGNRFGVCLLPTDLTLPPVDLARAVEARGLDMLFFAENSHVPVQHSKNAYHRPEIVEPFARMHDSITALAAAAAVTERILLGTGVCLLPERRPDHDREVDCIARSHLRRPRYLRYRRRLDQGSDRTSWILIQASLAHRARARARDTNLVARGTRRSITAITSILAQCGPTPNPYSPAVHRCTSVRIPTGFPRV